MQFFERRGDCEDYAMTKYESLLRLGFQKEQMRMLIVLDKESNTGHAVLAVDMPDGTYILDNQHQLAMKPEEMKRHPEGDARYLPISAYSEFGKWRFV